MSWFILKFLELNQKKLKSLRKIIERFISIHEHVNFGEALFGGSDFGHLRLLIHREYAVHSKN